MADQNGLDSVIALIDIMNEAPVLTQDEVHRLSTECRPSFVGRMINGGMTYGAAAGFPDFYKLGERDFFSHLRDNKDNLPFNIETIIYFLQLHYSRGEPVPPYYAERVAIILRKMKQPDIERSFLAAWCRHFGPDGGARFAALHARHEKMCAAVR